MICADHFEDECFNSLHQKGRIELKPGSVPTKHPNNGQNSTNADIDSEKNDTIAVASVPSPILPASLSIAAISSSLEKVTFSDTQIIPSLLSKTNVSLTIATAATAETAAATSNQNCCMNCCLKDKLIDEKDLQIKNLRKRLKKEQQKLWHLEKVRKKLNTAFLELKNKSLMNEEQCNVLRVCFFNLF